MKKTLLLFIIQFTISSYYVHLISLSSLNKIKIIKLYVEYIGSSIYIKENIIYKRLSEVEIYLIKTNNNLFLC